MLEAIFQEGILSLTLAGLTQWDYGQKLTIKGLTVSSALEVHFSNNAEKEAIVMSATKSGSDIITEIPNVLLEKDKDITAWVYTDDGQSGETIRTIVLKVTPRIKPADYISENNAGKVIDYVAKAEEYASSAQESAEIAQDNAEKVQANTDLVQDILANVPDFDSYEKLAEHNKLLYDGLYVKGETYSGIASNKGIKLHKVVGKTEQQTTKGYQLFDSSKLATKSQGGATVTNNGDGSFTVSGSGELTEQIHIEYRLTHEETVSLFKVGKLKGLRKPTDSTTRPVFRVVRRSDTINEELFEGFEITQEMLDDESFIISFGILGNVDQTIQSGTIKPMIYQDGDGTWEQFTGGKPAPNPYYPMEIENVEISKIISHGRQLFDSSKLATKSQGGATVTNNGDGSFTVSGSGNLTRDFSLSYVLTKEDIKYLFRPGRIYIKDAIRKAIYFEIVIHSSLGNIQLRNGDEYSFEKDFLDGAIDGRILFYGFEGSLIPNETCKPMVYQEGDGTWEPFKHASVETSLTLAEGDIYQNGTIIRARKQVVFDGSSDESWIRSAIQDQSRYRFLISIPDSASLWLNKTEQFCNRFPVGDTWSSGIKDDCFSVDGNKKISIYIDSLKNSSLEDFKSWLQEHHLEVEYKLATPTTEEFKVPTIPSYYPFTNVSTDNDLETEIQYEILANSDNSLYQEELEKRIEALEHAMLER